MQKTYERINWENEPSTKTPINEDNLNKIDYALDVVDTRVVGLYGYEERAKQSEENANASEESADANATLSKSYAVGGTGAREGEDEDNSKYYSEQAKEVATTLGAVLVPKGDVTFDELATVDAKTGYLYKITEDFTSNETFADGGGKFYLAGTKVYLNADGLWELLTSTSGGGGGESSTNDIAIPLLLDDWVANDDGTYSQKVYVAGLSADANVIIVPSYVGSSLTKEELKAYNCLVNDILIESGYITFKAKEIPSMSFTVVAQGTSATGDAVATVTGLVSKVDDNTENIATNTEAINQLNNDLVSKTKWNKLGATTTDNRTINISSVKDKANEFMCLIAYSGYRVTITIPNVYLDETLVYYYGGSGSTETGADQVRAVVSATSSEITFVSFIKNGADYSSGAMHVYYR